MKHYFIFFVFLITTINIKAFQHDDHRKAQVALGSSIEQADRPIEELLQGLGLLDYEEDSEPYIPPLPPLSPFINISSIPTKEQRKAQKKREHELLWSTAWEMITAKQDLDKPLIHWDKFKKHTLATAAAEHKIHLDILILLRLHGANLEAVDGYNHTPLEAAINCQCAPTIIYLLSQGYTLPSNPLHKICSPTHDTLNPGKPSRLETLQALLINRVNPNETNNLGSTVLELLLRYCGGKKNFWKTTDAEKLNARFLQQRKNMISMLLNAGLQPDKTNNSGQTALGLTQLYPAQYHPELVDFLKAEIQKREAK